MVKRDRLPCLIRIVRQDTGTKAITITCIFEEILGSQPKSFYGVTNMNTKGKKEFVVQTNGRNIKIICMINP